MDPDLETVIRQALGIAKAAGKDDMGQAEVTGLLMESPRQAVELHTLIEELLWYLHCHSMDQKLLVLSKR